MNNNEFKYSSIYITLGLFAVVLILSGIFLPNFFDFIEVKISTLGLRLFQTAFIISGLLDFWLVFYAKKKLS